MHAASFPEKKGGERNNLIDLMERKFSGKRSEKGRVETECLHIVEVSKAPKY